MRTYELHDIWISYKCNVQWTCIRFGLRNISTSVFDSDSSLNKDKLRVKSSRVATVTFQGIYKTRDELSSFLIENNVDSTMIRNTYINISQ